MCAASEHTQQDKNNTHKKKGVCGSVECDFVWVCSCVGVCSFFKFFYFVVVTPRGSPRSRADPLSLSCPPFIHSFPLYFFFLYTHSSSPPSLLAQRWMAPSLWWVTDEWSSSLKSRVTARLVKREETPDKRRRRGRGGREGEKGRKGGGRGEQGRGGGGEGGGTSNSEHP